MLKKNFFYFTAVLTGAAIMVIEIVGAKLLVPYMGTSHYVWTAQIGITLVALAFGYFLGGYIADRIEKPHILYVFIFLAAAYIVICVYAHRAISFWCLQWNLGVASLLASTILFFLPLTLLATSVPILMRELSDSLKSVGSHVGKLTAISTIGSFLGTLFVSYVMIPMLSNTTSLCLTAIILFVFANVYFIISFKKTKNNFILIILLCAAMVFCLSALKSSAQIGTFKHMKEIYRVNTHYGLLQVHEANNGKWRVLLGDLLVHNQYDMIKKQSMSEFTYLLYYFSRSYTQKINSVLCIGLGAGIVPKRFMHDGIEDIDVIEINDAMVDIAQEYFDFMPESVAIYKQDGRLFLNQCKKKYDTIILDTFQGDSSPVHLLSHETFLSIQSCLLPHGIFIINTYGEYGGENHFFTSSIYKTMKAVFPFVKIHSAGESTGGTFFIASNQDLQTDSYQPDFKEVHSACRKRVQKIYASVMLPDNNQGIIITDDYNPLDYYNAKNNESLRRHFVEQIKKL